MVSVRARLVPVVLAILSFAALESRGQNSTVADIQKQLLSRYQTAKATADGTDIVTAGSVLVLQKDHLLMCKVDQRAPMPNFYKNGAITQAGLGGMLKSIKWLDKLGSANPLASNATAGDATAAAAATREFVTGEKFWVTQITTVNDAVVFSLMSDPIKDQRYKALLTFPLPKGATSNPDDVVALVSEAVKTDAPEATADKGAANPVEKAAPTETKTIAIGQTRDQVIAMFGVPTKVVQLGPKEIDFFPDMKVTFVQNKVADVK